MKRTMTILSVGLVLAIAGTAGAASGVINLDLALGGGLGTYVGLGAAPDLAGNTTWNAVGISQDCCGGSLSNLVDSSGVGTTVDFSITSVWGSWNSAAGTMNGHLLMGEGAYSRGDTDTAQAFTISDLTPNTAYDLYMYNGGGESSTSATMTWVIGGTTKSTTAAVGAIFEESANYVVFSSVVSDGSGVIAGTWEGGEAGVNPAGASLWNGLQIAEPTEIPEPATMSLLALGGLGMLIKRRRKA